MTARGRFTREGSLVRSQPRPLTMPTTVDRDELQRLMRDEQAQLVEVLPAESYQGEHLPQAINIPLKMLDRETTQGLERERPVIVYCYDSQ